MFTGGTRHNRPQFYILLPILFGFGLFASLLTAGMSIQSHRAASSTEIGELLNAGTALFVDAMVVLFASVLGILLIRKMRIAAGGAMVALLCFAAYSMASVVGFGASERIAKYATITHNDGSTEQAVKDRNERALRDRDNAIGFVRDQIAKEKRDNPKREMLLASLKKLIAQPLLQEVWKAETVMADPEAEVFAKLLGLDIREFQIGKTIILSILLVLGKALCFGLGSAFWPVETVTAKTVAPATTTVTHATVLNPAESYTQLASTAIPAADSIDLQNIAPRVSSSGATKSEVSVAVALMRPRDGKANVGEFLRQSRAAAQRCKVIHAEAVFHWYRSGAIANVHDPPLSCFDQHWSAVSC